MKTFSDFITELRKPKEISDFKKDVKSTMNGVDTRNNDWRANLSKYMGAHGFSFLGSGKYASVYGNPKYSYVIKVFMRDSAYQRWLDFCLKNKDNKHVPKIKGKVIKISNDVFAIRLEKLTPLKQDLRRGDFGNAYHEWENDNSYKSEDKDINDILEFFSKNKNLIDIHSENIMMRGNVDVVVDPFYNFVKVKDGKAIFSIDPNEEIPGLF